MKKMWVWPSLQLVVLSMARNWANMPQSATRPLSIMIKRSILASLPSHQQKVMKKACKTTAFSTSTTWWSEMPQELILTTKVSISVFLMGLWIGYCFWQQSQVWSYSWFSALVFPGTERLESWLQNQASEAKRIQRWIKWLDTEDEPNTWSLLCS